MRDRIKAGVQAAAALLVFAGMPAAVAWFDSARVARQGVTIAQTGASKGNPPSAPPPVEPLEVRAVDTDTARVINARISFSKLPNPAARAFRFSGPPDALARAVDCLAAAGYYEAGDDAQGQKAVAQVVLNRLRHPAFPKTVCGVVFQGAERRTGCQFTFTCDGALARTPSADAWERAQDVARAALSGAVFSKVGYSTHYHTNWVVPYWSSSLDKVAAVDTHLFFRWAGWWGTPPAFLRMVSNDEPVVPQIARLSPAHHAAVGINPALPASGLGLEPPSVLAVAAARAIDADMLGKKVAGAKLIAIEPGINVFILLLDPKTPDSYPAIAMRFCTGRPRCRILAWSDPALVPKNFPLPDSALSTMAFSYMHDAASEFQRALWDCNRTPRTTRTQCMRVREPIAAVVPQSVPLLKTKPPETVVITTPK